MGDRTPQPAERERRWAEIHGRMEAVADLLSRQGSVASRLTRGGARLHSVRFVEAVEGRRRQRAIYVGADEVLVLRARDLIGQYRERERWTREAEEAARFVSASSALLRRTPSTRHGESTRRAECRAARGPASGNKKVEQGNGRVGTKVVAIGFTGHPAVAPVVQHRRWS